MAMQLISVAQLDAQLPLISLDDLKVYLKVDNDGDDETILGLAEGAVSMVEQYARVSLRPQSWIAIQDADCRAHQHRLEHLRIDRGLNIYRGPITAITAVKARGILGEYSYPTTDWMWNAPNPFVHWKQNFRYILNEPRLTIPDFEVNQFAVEYTAGYADGACPYKFLLCIKQLVAYWYENPASGNNNIPGRIAAILGPRTS